MSFQVKIRRKCKECKGEGVVQHADWAEFSRWRERHGNIQVAVNPSLANTPEEIDCLDCDGTGWVEEWVDAERKYCAGLGNGCYTVEVKL